MKLLRTINKKNLAGKIVLIRIDLNVLFERPEDMYRLDAVMPTIQYVLAAGAKVVLLSHKGRPACVSQKIFTAPIVLSQKQKDFSLQSFVPVLKKKLKTSVKFFPHFNFKKIQWEIVSGKEKVFLLENLRFCAGEEKNDSQFATALASLGDIYVNDAFAVSHRAHASVQALARKLPAYGGFCLEKEIQFLTHIQKVSRHPFVILLGGAKAKDKVGIIKSFAKKADVFLLGGSPANTFFVAQGEDVGASLYDAESIPFLQKYSTLDTIFLPLDDVIGNKKILDIGRETIDEYTQIIAHARMIFWNGTMGYYHDKKFAEGTKKIWEAILQNKKSLSVIGGGETIASLALLKKKPSELIKTYKNIFLSTGGGAMLEFVSGKKLPGIVVLK